MSKEMIRTLGIIAAASIASIQVQAQTSRTAPRAVQPGAQISGWVGITYSVEGRTDEDGRLVYSDYPVVVSVDPGSPAARAGIVAGDTILSFNDRDLLRHAFPIRAMIQPGKLFVIRAKRGSSTRVTKITVAERPSNRPEKIELAIREGQPGQPLLAAEGAMPRTPFVLTPGPQPLVRVTTIPRQLSTLSVPLAGAEIRALSIDLARSLGVKPEGLFVVNVADGTMAMESGLRDGDVLLRADNVPLLTPTDLRRVLESVLDRELKLDILRERKPKALTLRW
jgi:serine protease Do